MEPTKLDAIRALCPKTDFALVGKEETIRWIDMQGDSVPSDSAIDTKLTELKTAYNNAKYKRDRQPLYPHLADFADAMYWNSKGDASKLTAYYAACEKVKSDNPKPT